MKILAADIGGNSSRFAFFELERGERLALRQRRQFRTSEARSFGHLLEMLRESSFPVTPDAADIAVIAVPGPVLDGTLCAPPFISWRIDFSKATEEFGFSRWLLVNDFVAQAHAARSTAAAAATVLIAGRPVSGAAIAVVGAGTGFGQALLLPDGRGGHVAVPSEGGHAEFPFVGEAERDFAEFLVHRLAVDRITSAHVVSGAGLSNIHWHLSGRRLAPEDVTGELLAGTASLAWAARFYGRACKLYVLHGAAFGGLYIAGGVAVRTPALLTHPEFTREFQDSATMGDRLREVPVLLMADEDSGLWGAAELGRRQLTSGAPGIRT